MKFYEIPRIVPSNSIIWLEFKILLPSTFNPISILYNKFLMRKYGKSFDDEERYRFGEKLYFQQPQKNRERINTLFYNLLKDGYEVYIITSFDEKITSGFFDSLPAKIRLPKKNFHNSCSAEMKVEVVRELKKIRKTVIGLGASKEDEKALEESDFGFMVNPFYLGKKFENLKNLRNVNGMLHAIYFSQTF